MAKRKLKCDHLEEFFSERVVRLNALRNFIFKDGGGRRQRKFLTIIMHTLEESLNILEPKLTVLDCEICKTENIKRQKLKLEVDGKVVSLRKKKD